MGWTWNRGLLFQSEDNVEVIRGNGRQLSNAAYSKRSGIVVSRTIPQPSLAGHAAQLSRYWLRLSSGLAETAKHRPKFFRTLVEFRPGRSTIW